MTQLTPSTHSRFSPSGSKRWMLCPGSVPFVESLKLPHRDSEYAIEGTACHELAAHCLQNQILDGSEFEDVVFYKDVKTNREMILATNEYVAYVLSFMHEGSTLEVEQRVEMDDLLIGTGGTSDAFIWSKDEFHCFDLKYGQGVPVEVEDNYQLMLYAAGRIRELHQSGKINSMNLKRICLHIIQPRSPHPNGPCRHWDTGISRLRTHWREAKAAIASAISPYPPINPGPDQCVWCDGAPVCKKLAEYNLEVAMCDFAELENSKLDLISSNQMTNENIANVLKHSAMLENWLNATVAYAQGQLERGQPVPGYKLVRGRSNRGWKPDSETEIVQWLIKHDFDAAHAYSEPKFKSPTQIENLVGKKNAKDLNEFIIKPLGKITIAPSDDKREEVFVDNSPQGDFASFAENSNAE